MTDVRSTNSNIETAASSNERSSLLEATSDHSILQPLSNTLPASLAENELSKSVPEQPEPIGKSLTACVNSISSGVAERSSVRPISKETNLQPLSNTLPVILNTTKSPKSDDTSDNGVYLLPLSNTLPTTLDKIAPPEHDSEHRGPKKTHVKSIATYVDLKVHFPHSMTSTADSSQQAPSKELQSDMMAKNSIEMATLQNDAGPTEPDGTCSMPLNEPSTTPPSVAACDNETNLQPLSNTLPKSFDKSNNPESDEVRDNGIYLPTKTKPLESDPEQYAPMKPIQQQNATNVYASVESTNSSTEPADFNPKTPSSPSISTDSSKSLSFQEAPTDETYSEPFTQTTCLTNAIDDGTYLQPISNALTAEATSDSELYLQPLSNTLPTHLDETKPSEFSPEHYAPMKPISDQTDANVYESVTSTNSEI